jgi:DNA-binding phage protein
MDDVLVLLRQEVEKAGGQSAWSKKTGIERTVLNRVLHGYRPPTAKMIEALDLCIVFTPRNSTSPKRLPIRQRSLQRLAVKSKPLD